jgi:hypothetical protein
MVAEKKRSFHQDLSAQVLCAESLLLGTSLPITKKSVLYDSLRIEGIELVWKEWKQTL